MLCLNCKEHVENEFLFCPWCGTEQKNGTTCEENITAEIAEQVRKIKKHRQALRDTQSELAFRIREVFRKKEYLDKYASFEDYGRVELELNKSMLFMYKDVGEAFVDKDGNWMIAKAGAWGIGKLYELRQLRRAFTMKEINFLIEDGILLNPDYTLPQVRNIVKKLLEVENHCKS